jgi:hypothetical protein
MGKVAESWYPPLCTAEGPERLSEHEVVLSGAPDEARVPVRGPVLVSFCSVTVFVLG